ncbi:MAG: response regulator [Verrucomicrobia bacterium]|nr:response regulator [Verrucomicrobiota bacterium]
MVNPNSKKTDLTCDTRLKDVAVLAVDRNGDSRELLKVMLDSSNAEAKVVSSGKEALIAITDFHPDVLICDLAVPYMEGYDLLTSIRQLEPEISHVPAIACLTAARDEDRAATQRAGFQAHLAKPIDPEELITTILALVRVHKH